MQIVRVQWGSERITGRYHAWRIIFCVLVVISKAFLSPSFPIISTFISAIAFACSFVALVTYVPFFSFFSNMTHAAFHSFPLTSSLAAITGFISANTSIVFWGLIISSIISLIIFTGLVFLRLYGPYNVLLQCTRAAIPKDLAKYDKKSNIHPHRIIHFTPLNKQRKIGVCGCGEVSELEEEDYAMLKEIRHSTNLLKSDPVPTSTSTSDEDFDNISSTTESSIEIVEGPVSEDVFVVVSSSQSRVATSKASPGPHTTDNRRSTSSTTPPLLSSNYPHTITNSPIPSGKMLEGFSFPRFSGATSHSKDSFAGGVSISNIFKKVAHTPPSFSLKPQFPSPSFTGYRITDVIEDNSSAQEGKSPDRLLSFQPPISSHFTSKSDIPHASNFPLLPRSAPYLHHSGSFGHTTAMTRTSQRHPDSARSSQPTTTPVYNRSDSLDSTMSSDLGFLSKPRKRSKIRVYSADKDYTFSKGCMKGVPCEISTSWLSGKFKQLFQNPMCWAIAIRPLISLMAKRATLKKLRRPISQEMDDLNAVCMNVCQTALGQAQEDFPSDFGILCLRACFEDAFRPERLAFILKKYDQISGFAGERVTNIGKDIVFPIVRLSLHSRQSDNAGNMAYKKVNLMTRRAKKSINQSLVNIGKLLLFLRGCTRRLRKKRRLSMQGPAPDIIPNAMMIAGFLERLQKVSVDIGNTQSIFASLLG
ncbi:hypothetical protein ADUPG1_012069, partial [Aduncisulcus paluster]